MKINTADVSPVKERMRRAPVFYVGEEEAHRKKMLDTGVIQPFMSKCASAPVLFRKKSDYAWNTAG